MIEPVLDHDHYTHTVKGMCCKKCNFSSRNEAWDNFRLTCFFHNFSSYDSSFIVRYLKKPTTTIGAERSRKDVWRVRMKGNKIHRLKTRYIDFRDSLNLVPVSIGSMGQNLPLKEMHYVNGSKWVGEDVGKNIYPYRWVDSVKRLQETKFPDIKQFESNLSGKVKLEDYTYSAKLYEENCEKFLDWHVHYLERDFNTLCDCLVHMQTVIYTKFGIDILKCQSIPSCAKQAMLKVTRVKLQLITSPSMHAIFQSSIKGGLCVTALRSHRVYDHTTESLKYIDVKSLYGSVQSLYPHPIGDFQFVMPIPSPEEIMTKAMSFDDKNSKVGYLCVVDLKIPHNLHSVLSDFPVTFEKMTVDHSSYPPTPKWAHLPKSRVPKLVPSLIDPKHYTISMLSLKFLVNLGIKVTRGHHLISFSQGYFLREFVNICLEMRGKKDCSKLFSTVWKLIMNGLRINILKKLLC